jgi:hypothetical protein
MTQDQDLFTFGTLMDTELLQIVCRQPLDSLVLEPAFAVDQARRWVLDDHYPVLIASPGSRIEGVIIRGLQEEAMNRIVFFEGDEFTLRRMTVELPDCQSEAVNYFAHNQRKPVSEQEWRLAEWQRSTKQDTLSRVERYMRCYGVMTTAEADAYW